MYESDKESDRNEMATVDVVFTGWYKGSPSDFSGWAEKRQLRKFPPNQKIRI